MRLTRGLVVLAIVAALWGAPLSASAAVNELSSPQVSPGGGSVTTVFTFRVRYEGGFGAVAVSVSVAGLTVPMALESGLPTAGWWSGSTLLPSGAWSTAFRATATQGPSASVGGPVVIVAGLAPASPTESPAAPPSSGAIPASAPADGVDRPAAPAAPAPSPGGTSPTPAGPSTAPAAPAPNEAQDGSGGSGAPSQGGSPSVPAPGGDGAPPGQGAPAASPATSAAARQGDPGVVQPAADREPRDDTEAGDEMVSDVILVGLAGVASVAVIGTLFLIAGRRREPARATVPPTPSVAGDRPRRALVRTGRTQPSDDPIVAALGVDDEMAARRAIRRAGRASDDGRAAKGRQGR